MLTRVYRWDVSRIAWPSISATQQIQYLLVHQKSSYSRRGLKVRTPSNLDISKRCASSLVIYRASSSRDGM
ncbi:MAG: hypothetical protein JWO62_2351 [Acidimicrobiaceae bacterium]|nr:hypothetical protein [Acidimicrobiaceae bacterium]